MRQRIGLTLAIVIALSALFFFVKQPGRSGPRSPLAISAIEELSRVEISPAGSERAAVLERRGEQWFVTSPFEDLVAAEIARTLDDAFDEPLRADDHIIDGDFAPKYEVDDAQATRVKLWSAADGDEPSVDLLVGDQTMVRATRAHRTFVREPGQAPVYKLQALLGALHIDSISRLRSLQVTDFGQEGFSAYTLAALSGEPVELAMVGERWELVGLDAPIDQVLARQVVKVLSSVRALRAEDRADIPEWEETAAITVDGVRFRVGKAGDERCVMTRSDREDVIYMISCFQQERLSVAPDSLRSKVPRPLDVAKISRVELAGEGAAVLVRGGGGWGVEGASDEIDAAEVERIVSLIATLRVHEYLGEGELVKPGESIDQVVIEVEGGARVVLELGARLPPREQGGAPTVLARFSGDAELFSLIGPVADQMYRNEGHFKPYVDGSSPR